MGIAFTLEEVVAALDKDIAACDEELATFVSNVGKDIGYALEWGALSALRCIQRRRILKRLRAMSADAETERAAKKAYFEKLLYDALHWCEHSSASVMANVAGAARRQAIAKVLEIKIEYISSN